MWVLWCLPTDVITSGFSTCLQWQGQSKFLSAITWYRSPNPLTINFSLSLTIHQQVFLVPPLTYFLTWPFHQSPLHCIRKRERKFLIQKRGGFFCFNLTCGQQQKYKQIPEAEEPLHVEIVPFYHNFLQSVLLKFLFILVTCRNTLMKHKSSDIPYIKFKNFKSYVPHYFSLKSFMLY